MLSGYVLIGKLNRGTYLEKQYNALIV